MKPKIYIASPYTLGDQAENVRRQIKTADQILNAGFIPFVPLLAHFQHMVCPRPYEDWMHYDLTWLASCDYLIRLPGESKGADMEVKRAEELNIPVTHSMEELKAIILKSVNPGYIMLKRLIENYYQVDNIAKRTNVPRYVQARFAYILVANEIGIYNDSTVGHVLNINRTSVVHGRKRGIELTTPVRGRVPDQDFANDVQEILRQVESKLPEIKKP